MAAVAAGAGQPQLCNGTQHKVNHVHAWRSKPGRASDLMSRPARRARMAWHSTSPAAMVQPDTAAARSTGCRSSMAVWGGRPGNRRLSSWLAPVGQRRQRRGAAGGRLRRSVPPAGDLGPLGTCTTMCRVPAPAGGWERAGRPACGAVEGPRGYVCAAEMSRGCSCKSPKSDLRKMQVPHANRRVKCRSAALRAILRSITTYAPTTSYKQPLGTRSPR